MLGASNELVILHLPPVEMHLHKLIVDVERPPAQQGRGVVGHSEQLQSVAGVLREREGLVSFKFWVLSLLCPANNQFNFSVVGSELVRTFFLFIII